MYKTAKASWGIYDMMSNPKVPSYFFFTPTISIMHYPGATQGGLYIGWLMYCLFIPYNSNKNKRYEFHLLPLLAWRKIQQKSILSFSWLFWSTDYTIK